MYKCVCVCEVSYYITRGWADAQLEAIILISTPCSEETVLHHINP